MKTIVISGSRSNIGKTFLAEKILQNLKGWAALKVTVSHTGAKPSKSIGLKSECPRHKDCGVCSGIGTDYKIIKDRRIINQTKTDTARMKEAGAKRVIWLKASLKNLKEGLGKALGELKGVKGVVIEGTSVMRHVKADLAIYLKDENFTIKPSASYAAEKADIIINISKKSC